MKCTRKLASLLLALVMVFALAVTAFATEAGTTTTTGSITVDNPVAERTYTAYKIFDVVYDTNEANGTLFLHHRPAAANGSTLSVPMLQRRMA